MIKPKKIIQKFQGNLMLCGFFVLLSGCSTVNYGVANQGSLARYMAKPVYKNTSNTAFYISGQYYNNNNQGYDEVNEFSQFGDLMIHRSHTLKNWNYAYGILGYLGSYQVNGVYNFRGRKSFAGGGILGEINYNIPFEKIDLRVVGLRAGILYETGDYAKFRKRADQLNYIVDINPENSPFFAGITSEVIYKFDSFDVGVQFNISYISKKNSEALDPVKFYQNIHLTYDDFSLVGTFAFLSEKNHVYSTGLQYRF